jgi:hypothetical protein
MLGQMDDKDARTRRNRALKGWRTRKIQAAVAAGHVIHCTSGGYQGNVPWWKRTDVPNVEMVHA